MEEPCCCCCWSCRLSAGHTFSDICGFVDGSLELHSMIHVFKVFAVFYCCFRCMLQLDCYGMSMLIWHKRMLYDEDENTHQEQHQEQGEQQQHQQAGDQQEEHHGGVTEALSKLKLGLRNMLHRSPET